MSRTQSDLAAYIAKEISYDGSEVQSQVLCQNCGKVARKQIISHWIDHRGVLASNIATFMGFGARMMEVIDDELGCALVEGNPREDGAVIASALFRSIFEARAKLEGVVE